MLEHQKIVLRGVSDNKELFKKELVKSHPKDNSPLMHFHKGRFKFFRSTAFQHIFLNPGNRY